MRPIRMVDLKTQYDKIKPEVDAAIHEVLDTTSFINGPAVQRFQKNLEQYLGVKHVIPCANGTDALQVSMMALDLKPGDEVITVSFTFVATVEVIALLKLTPILVDVEPGTFNMDIEALKKAITPKTKAIVPVHLFGQCVNMDEVMEIAKQHNLFVIEDACQSIGSEYTFKDGTKKKSGTIGHIGTTSFFPSKNLGCYGDGGAIFTDDDALATRIRFIVNHGMHVRYYHEEIGVNSRLDSIQAAILNVKLKHLDEYAAARQKAAAGYKKAFGNNPHLQVPIESDRSTHVYHQYTLVTKDINRDKLLEHLQAKNIPCAIYYPVAMHMQKAYLDHRYKEGDLPVTEHLCKTVISLPMHSELDEEQVAFIAGAVLEYVNSER
jgi:dTDP-4-amino-4,6-dideoxygalactose transaminase